jgi:hypothetical protein
VCLRLRLRLLRLLLLLLLFCLLLSGCWCHIPMHRPQLLHKVRQRLTCLHRHAPLPRCSVHPLPAEACRPSGQALDGACLQVLKEQLTYDW